LPIMISMQLSPSWQGGGYLSGQEIPGIWCNLRILSPSWARWIQSTASHPISSRSLLILHTHLPLDIPSILLPSRLRTKPSHVLVFSPLRTTCPAHLILLHSITRIIFRTR
jgi:hypothetical protein